MALRWARLSALLLAGAISGCVGSADPLGPVGSETLESSPVPVDPAAAANKRLLKTAIVGPKEEWRIYAPRDPNANGLSIYRSDDGGATWTESELPAETTERAYSEEQLFPVFRPGESASWLLATSGPAMGLMDKKLYRTQNGGLSWELEADIGSTVDGYVTGMAFRDERNGWVTASYHGDDLIPVYRTRDAGLTWELLELEVPESYRYGNAYPPSFDEGEPDRGEMSIEFHAADRMSTVVYSTRDGGDSWTAKAE